MQVSWIDPHEVSRLLMQIAGPVASPGPTAWETHTYPLGEAEPQPTDEVARLPVQAPPLSPAPVVAPVQAPQPIALPLPPVAAPAQPLQGLQVLTAMPQTSPASALSTASSDPIAPIQEATQAANTELERIRQRLRELRERAQQSGVISTTASPALRTAFTAEASTTTPPVVEAVTPLAGLPPLTQPTNELAPQPDSGSLHYGGHPAEAAHLVQPSIEQPFSIAPVQLATAAVKEPSLPVITPHLRLPESPAAVNPTQLEATPPLRNNIEADNPRVDRPTFQAPDRGLTERLAALALWACQRLQTQEVVLVDDFGDVLWGSPGHTALVLSGMMAWHSAQRANALQHMDNLSRRIDREMQGGQQLTIVPVRTRYGVVSLAAIRTTKMDDSDVDAIHHALALAVEGVG